MTQARRQRVRSQPHDVLSQASSLRYSIIEEDRLRREIARDEEVSRNALELWRLHEASRRQTNRETAGTNRRLRQLGLAALPMRPSLAHRRRELQRLHQHNEAAIATVQGSQRAAK